jgi:hypothetical protein
MDIKLYLIVGKVFLVGSKMNKIKIKSIKDLGFKKEMQCITIKDPEGLYLACDKNDLNKKIITHNSPSSTYCQVMIAGSQKKSSENLLEPMIQLMESSPFFERCRSKTQMQDGIRAFEESENEIDKIYWTTASPTSPIEMAGGSRYKLISSPGQLLGQNLITATMTELTFLMSDFHWALGLNEDIYINKNKKIKNRDIKIGDKILLPNGKQSKVKNLIPWPNEDTYELEFANGVKIRCNKDHIWKVRIKTTSNAWSEWFLATTKLILNHPETEWDFPEVEIKLNK